MRRIVANLDLEEELRGRYGGHGPARTLSAAARGAAAAAGARLVAFARRGDRLWLPAPLPRDALPGLGAADVVLESGPLEELAPAGRLLAWGEAPRVAALRTRWEAPPERDGERALRAPLHEAVWHLPAPPPEVVARVAHRGFCLELARERGWALPGARWVEDPADLEEHLARGGARAGGGRWVVKAPYSAAGRERHVASGAAALSDPRVRRRIERLVERHGRLLAEPWVERSADFGCAGLLTRGGLRVASVHAQRVDPRGAFRRVLLAEPGTGPPGLATPERDLLEAAFQAAAERLRAAGYEGPFGVDAFRWRRPGGSLAFHPLCEINPRITFGLVARAQAEREGGHGT